MSKEILVNMENVTFDGNVLDIGFENSGVIYNIYKKNNKNINVEYLIGKEDKVQIKENFYDTCILFFCLNNFWPNIRKRKFLSNIKKYLKEDGVIYVWDMDKGYSKIVNCTLKIIMPKREMRRIKMRDFNLLKNNSKENTIKALEKYFSIIDIKAYGGIYCIKAKKVNEVNKEFKDSQNAVNTA
ncbi:class I SAM-dependent methyltransferase [Clostridium sp. JN-1]|uniref:class I SAM-dependent methyltransferase n=1 Tax=Clostridium sp. JN-1 TaxID=2483110 RepID=UPI000F0BD20D|nr:class I SAM-dependent methyltransferase [Clostridium sp. JN-1]